MSKSVNISSAKRQIKEIDNLDQEIFESSDPIKEAHDYSESIQNALMHSEMSPFILTDETEFIIVENNIPICLSLTKYLQKQGFDKIRFCDQVTQGIALFEHFVKSEKKPVLFMGHALIKGKTKKILSKIFQSNPETKIIILTVRGNQDSEIQEAIEMGVFSCLEKPLSYSSVKKLIEDIQEEDSTQEITFLH